MDLRGEYDVWHQRVFDSDPEHEDASTPWYQLVRERLGEIAVSFAKIQNAFEMNTMGRACNIVTGRD